jgi:hypothetical protein
MTQLMLMLSPEALRRNLFLSRTSMSLICFCSTQPARIARETFDERDGRCAGVGRLILLPLDSIPHHGNVGEKLLADRLLNSATISHKNKGVMLCHSEICFLYNTATATCNKAAHDDAALAIAPPVRARMQLLFQVFCVDSLNFCA